MFNRKMLRVLAARVVLKKARETSLETYRQMGFGRSYDAAKKAETTARKHLQDEES